MKRNKPYTFDDYIKDREAQVAQSAAGSPRAVSFQPSTNVVTPQSLRGQGLVNRKTQVSGLTDDRRQKAQVSTPTVGSPTVSTPTATATTPAAGAGSSALTSFDLLNYDMDAARQRVLDVLNQKFQYKAKESPIYTILQQQYERQAQEAAGKAYAAAVANTGGYGSSYATLAGEEARRQVMEGWNDQQLALYQAAREEFDAERDSILDWYSTVRQLKTDAEADSASASGMNDATYKLLIDASTNGWYTGTNGNALRAKLETYKAGEPSIDVDAIMSHLEREYQAGLADLNETQVTVDEQKVLEATSYLQSVYGSSYSEGAMLQDLVGKGYTEAEAKAALDNQRKFAASITTDYKPSTVSDAISNASTLREAFTNKQMSAEEYDTAVADNSKIIMENVNAAMKNIDDADYHSFGYTDEEWNGMEDGEKKLAVFDSVGQLVKEGVVPHSAYYKLLYNDLQEEFNGDNFKESKTQIRDALDMALVIQDLHDNGYLLQDEYTSLVYNQIIPELIDTRFWSALDKQDIDAGGEKKYSWWSNPFNSLENYDNANSYGSPELAKISRGLSEEHKKLMLELVRGKRNATPKKKG